MLPREIIKLTINAKIAIEKMFNKDWLKRSISTWNDEKMKIRSKKIKIHFNVQNIMYLKLFSTKQFSCL